MAKSVTTYWNSLAPESKGRWTPIRGLGGMAEEPPLSIDPATGEYTRLTRFHPGADTTPFGGKTHTYPEEGLPRSWIARLKRAIRTLGWRFHADRMVMDYVRKCYLPAAAGTSSDMSRL